MKTIHWMRIRDLSLRAHLGCSAEERAKTQEVRVSIDLRFAQPPGGAVSDRLDDTLCYARVCDALKKHTQDREFHLIEKMAEDFHGIVCGFVEGRAEVGVTVHKVAPPVESLLGGVEYRIGHFS